MGHFFSYYWMNYIMIMWMNMKPTMSLVWWRPLEREILNQECSPSSIIIIPLLYNPFAARGYVGNKSTQGVSWEVKRWVSDIQLRHNILHMGTWTTGEWNKKQSQDWISTPLVKCSSCFYKVILHAYCCI